MSKENELEWLGYDYFIHRCMPYQYMAQENVFTYHPCMVLYLVIKQTQSKWMTSLETKENDKNSKNIKQIPARNVRQNQLEMLA